MLFDPLYLSFCSNSCLTLASKSGTYTYGVPHICTPLPLRGKVKGAASEARFLPHDLLLGSHPHLLSVSEETEAFATSHSLKGTSSYSDWAVCPLLFCYVILEISNPELRTAYTCIVWDRSRWAHRGVHGSLHSMPTQLTIYINNLLQNPQMLVGH